MECFLERFEKILYWIIPFIVVIRIISYCLDLLFG
nr:MAG TPA: hypothetical protein [Caudoviricetes sp.]